MALVFLGVKAEKKAVILHPPVTCAGMNRPPGEI